MNRLETRHWIIIAIMVIVSVAMYSNVPLESLTAILATLGGLAGVDFIIKRIKEAKASPAII